ncbi:phage Gp37/Gp68 family protein [Mesorhizobium sp. M0136]|uniref:DUF5131 family protein n=1 Tax=Mesorhizobium sp. M0136 TaxID=2956890 RepID=UPI0033399C75
MADHSSIEWTDATWNPITGCSIVSPGCTNCYAMKLAGTRLKHIDSRKGLTRDTVIGPVWSGEVRLNRQWLHQPIAWKKPRKIFVCAHGDLFAENVPDEWIDRVFAVMALAPRHTFQVLTKRSKRMREYLTQRDSRQRWRKDAVEVAGMNMVMEGVIPQARATVWPIPNVWLGVSAERQKEADDRVPELLATPAAIRFASAEPLLGPIRFDRIGEWTDTFQDCGGHPDPHWPTNAQDATWLNALVGEMGAEARDPSGKRLGDIDVGLRHEGGKLDWIIVGGESGHNARPMNPAWARSIRDQCAAASVPFFFKQWGEFGPAFNLDLRPTGLPWSGEAQTAVARGTATAEQATRRFGKRRAGRLLDGVEHNSMPEASA